MAGLGTHLVAFVLAALQIAASVSGDDIAARLRSLPANTATGLSLKEVSKHPKKHKPKGQHRAAFQPPIAFDARKQWPQCKSISLIRDQGKCGDCWAVSSAAVLSDRLCIVRGKQDLVSAMQVAGCSYPKQDGLQNCDKGGNAPVAYRSAVLYGFSTGGELDSKVGCVPYEIKDEMKPITCQTKCTNSKYKVPLQNDSLANQVDSYWIEYNYDMRSQESIDAAVLQMQHDIFDHGPISASFKIWSDFMQWKSDKGPYSIGPDAKPDGGHAIRIIGWNQTREGVRYWLISNSWGEYWGEKGIYWIEMGRNVAGIEASASAPIIKLDKHCDAASFCSAPIDQAVKMDHTDPKAPVFLFQGDCLLQVQTKAGKLVPIGKAEPIGKRIVNVVKAPIMTHRFNEVTKELYLVNGAGETSTSCIKAERSTKYVCEDRGKVDPMNEAFTVTATGRYYKYDGNGHTLWSGAAYLDSEGGRKGELNDVLSSSPMTNVNAFLDIDGTKMYVFGKDTNGKPLTGIMQYHTDNTDIKVKKVTADGRSANFHDFILQWVKKPAAPSGIQTC